MRTCERVLKPIASAIPPPGHEAILPVNLTYIYKGVEYARFMNTQRNPEVVSGGSAVTVEPSTNTKRGVIIFNPLTPGTLTATLQAAVSAGDTIEKRTREFNASLNIIPSKNS